MLDHLRRDQILVVFVHRVAHAIFVQPVQVFTCLELPVYPVLNNCVDGIVDALDHTGQDESWLEHVLICIDTNNEMGCVSILRPGLLHRVKGSESGVSCRSEDHVGAFADLCQRDFFALAGIVPGGVGDTNIVWDYANVGIDGARAFLVATLEPVNQPNVHPAEKADRARLAGLRSQHAHQV